MANLLEQASILLTPTAYDNGSMLSVKPENGDGDFTFSRGSGATRRNEQGVIELVASNIPRINYEGFNYDANGAIIPDSGCGSWLFEPQSTNLVTYSSDYSQWSVLNSALLPNNAISPSGVQDASKLNTTTASSRIQVPLSFSGVNTISIFVKYDGDDVTVRFERNTSNDRCSFDISSTGVVFNSAETGIIDYKIENFGNDWYRLSCVYDGGNYFQFNGDTTGAGGSIYIWGAQAEQQSSATSYIPTSGAIVTRLADEATINLTSFTLTSITETIDGADQTPITTIPTTYSVPFGNINKIIMI